MRSVQALVTLIAFVSSVYGHGAIVNIQGSNGVTAMAMGVVATTPRDGSRRNPFQTDSSIINDEEIESGEASPCGRTLQGGVNNIASSVDAASSAGLPAMSADGTITMTVHQVNGDGAGPYTCDVSTDATGTSFQPATVITNVPGRNSRSRARAQAFPLVVQAAPGTACTGGPNGDACIVRCRNGARAGPFGGCAVVTNAAPAVAPAPVAPAPAPVAAPAPVVAPAPVAAPVEAPAAAVPPVATVPAPVVAPVAPVEAPAAEAPAAGVALAPEGTIALRSVADEEYEDAVDEEEEEMKMKVKRSIVDSLTSLFAKRDHSRKRMVNSRIIEKAKRNMWI